MTIILEIIIIISSLKLILIISKNCLRYLKDTNLKLFNLAAETHVDRSIDGPEAFIKANFNGTLLYLNV